ncbi:hypothetical protein EDD11_003808 [Mortierella claussenii]|nr:hypothetical protein EDD11_003808 [Mortierella claussenii]
MYSPKESCIRKVDGVIRRVFLQQDQMVVVDDNVDHESFEDAETIAVAGVAGTAGAADGQGEVMNVGDHSTTHAVVAAAAAAAVAVHDVFLEGHRDIHHYWAVHPVQHRGQNEDLHGHNRDQDKVAAAAAGDDDDGEASDGAEGMHVSHRFHTPHQNHV